MTRHAARFVLCIAMLAASTSAFAQLSDADVERIRAALEKPAPRLSIEYPNPTPTFRVHIIERRPLQDMFEVPSWMPEKPGWQPPAVGFDLMSIVRYVAHEVSEAKRGHDVRLAREEVLREIANYCAAQPNNGAGITICTNASAIR